MALTRRPPRHSSALLPPSPGRARFGPALALSICLHLVLIVAWQATPRATNTPAAALQLISLAEIPPQQTATQSPPAPQRPTEAETTQPPLASQRLASRQASDELRVPAPTPQTHQPQPSAAASLTPSTPVTETWVTESKPQPTHLIEVAALKQHLTQQLIALAHHFHYPFVARKRGWEGEVLLAVRITAQGLIEDVQLATSSGHRILDRAALKAMAAIGALPPSSDLLALGTSLELQVPIIYQLEG